MPKHFMKTTNCGCTLITTTVGTRKENNTVLYLIGNHKHINICETCNQNRLNGIDICGDICDDDVTDGSGNDGWVECGNNN